MKKVFITIAILIAVVLAVLISVSVLKHPDIAMQFDTMRNTTDEENQNNACNLGMMAANEEYICFFDKKYGLVCYDIDSDQYTILGTVFGTSWLTQTPNNEVYYNILQIQDGCLYYAKNNQRNQAQTGIWKVDLKSKRKEQIPTNQYDSNGYFSVNGEFILLQAYLNQLFRLEGDNAIELASDVKGFAFVGENIYYADGGAIFKQNIYNEDTKKMICNNESLVKGCDKFYVNDSKIYFTSTPNVEPYIYGLYIIENDIVSEIAGVQFKKRPELVFYENYIVSNLGIYSSNWEQLVEFEYSDSISPVIVGGNLYAYSSNQIDLPSIGEGWYKIDIEKLIG